MMETLDYNLETFKHEFQELIKGESYISKKKVDDFFEKYSVPLKRVYNEEFNSTKKDIEDLIDKKNDEYLNKMYLKYKSYFENMYKGIDDRVMLDEEQIKAILADEDYALIIAGAGTGKTTTMTSKVKYLVDVKKVDPAKILVMSYTKKATAELEERIVKKFKIKAHVTTFHSLGYDYIRAKFPGRKCEIVDENFKNKIFLDYFKGLFKDKSKVRELIDNFSVIKVKKWMFADYFKRNYEKYETFEEFFEHYKEYKRNDVAKRGIKWEVERRIEKDLNGENVLTIKGEFVKSVAEGRIANYLFRNGIDYEYEKIYSNLMDENATYKPDFTLSLASEEVYLEYFGLDDEDYNEERKLKEKYHKDKHNLFISLDSSDFEHLEKNLEAKLIELGFAFKPKTYEEIFEQMLDNNPLAQLYKFKDFIYECIDCIKSSVNRDKYYKIAQDYLKSLEGNEKQEATIQFKYINEFYKIYEDFLHGAESYRFDYSDLIFYPKKYVFEIPEDKLKFDYIIIDEYQDISKDKYDLVKNTADRCHAKVFAVGDDWQSIFAFSGARIDYIYKFNEYFKNSKQFRITKTHRNSQELIDTTGTFIMKNRYQIQKKLISDSHLYQPIKFIEYDTSGLTGIAAEREEYECLKKLILKIHKVEPNSKILILGRNNDMIDKLFDHPAFKDDLGTKIKFVGYRDINLEGMTMHKSKGLTFDEVIIIGLNNKFPNIKYSSYWLIEELKNSLLNEEIPFAEERRLFYVALTRTRNRVFLITDKNPKKRSKFVDEISRINSGRK